MQNFRVSLVQGDTRWHDPKGNHDYYGKLIKPLAGQTDLVVLPETFTSGFSNAAIEQAEDMHGPTLDWLLETSRRLDAAITGSVQIKADGAQGQGVYNRMLFVTPDGDVQHYDKRHLFRYADEHKRYAAGAERLVVTWRGWRILPQVCYDLRFPVWIRNRRDASAETGMEYDLMVFVANWPSPRRNAWRTLLRARAIENLACCVGVNRVGIDGNEHVYTGDSAALDPLGEPLVDLGAKEQVVTVTLDANQLLEHRRHFPAWMDADAFEFGQGA
ncbi:MAG TPA: amidohydrolase [Oleiagrimonas sp.]|nr:amidohydrolase [Oleiagrimonas sp.]